MKTPHVLATLLLSVPVLASAATQDIYCPQTISASIAVANNKIVSSSIKSQAGPGPYVQLGHVYISAYSSTVKSGDYQFIFEGAQIGNFFPDGVHGIATCDYFSNSGSGLNVSIQFDSNKYTPDYLSKDWLGGTKDSDPACEEFGLYSNNCPLMLKAS